jgi:hypothetical protein
MSGVDDNLTYLLATNAADVVRTLLSTSSPQDKDK